MSYTKEERETHISLCDAEPEFAYIFTRQRKVMSKILKMEVKEITDQEIDDKGNIISMTAKVPTRSITLRLKNKKRKGHSNAFGRGNKE